MSLSQPSPVVPPLATDARLTGFSQIIQSSFGTLFQAAHVHKIVTAVPDTRTGAVGDIYILDDGTSIYLCVKTNRGWAKSSAFTLI